MSSKFAGQVAPGYTRPCPAGWYRRRPQPAMLLVRRPDFTFTALQLIIPASAPPAGRPRVATAALHYHSPSLIMLTGTVKFYNDSKGFGFIVADDNQEEIFVHQTGLIHEIQDGDRVEFDIKEGKKGPNAVKVTRLQ